jgi:hypothetical protein
MDRRAYIENKVSAATPSYGHIALAGLLKMSKAHIVWTTNFDRVIEDAIIRLFGGSAQLVVASLGEPELALQALNGARWPLVGKLHGDFHSRRLKNIPEELRAQDANLRRALLEACRRYGLAVIGYSGRDESVMETLCQALDDGHGYPAGLFWFHRSGSVPFARARDLIDQAQSVSIDAHFVEVETFDELLADVIRLVPDVPTEITQQLDSRTLRVSPARLPSGQAGWPIVRLNALPLLSAPTICRRVQCDINGSRQVRKAIQEASAQVIATRRQVGVLAFGSDSEIRKAFEGYKIKGFDVHSIETRRLRYDSPEHYLLYEAIACALARERPVSVERKRGSTMIVADRAQLDHEALQSLKRATGQLTGTIAGTGLRWAEAARIRLDHKLDQLWLLLDPTIWVEQVQDETAKAAAKEFVRDRLARRYNATWNSVLDGWVGVVVGADAEAEIRTFGIGDGVDAAFNIGRVTAFSHRGVRP